MRGLNVLTYPDLSLTTAFTPFADQAMVYHIGTYSYPSELSMQSVHSMLVKRKLDTAESDENVKRALLPCNGISAWYYHWLE
jgi:hypothetical protein